MPSPPATPATVAQLADTLGRAPTHEEQDELLWAMTVDERQAAMYRGDLTQYQCFAWAQRRPYEVPRLNGEVCFIAAWTPEAVE